MILDGSQDALTSIDRDGKKLVIIPAEVKGFFHRWRRIVHLTLLVVFLTLPWIQINGTQAILIDIIHRRFAIFGMQFWSHDGPLIFFLLAILTLGLAWMTAVFGRIWCGWACPQTVFIDTVYRKIEQWIEGNYIARRNLEKSTMTFRKFRLRLLKWTAFAIVSSLIAHSFIAYFVGSTELIGMIRGGPSESWSYFLLISAVTGALLFNFGWFREQFCVIMCPYGRFQSVLMDDRSLTIYYDTHRGEPRKSPATPKEKQGACVSCSRCVEVCPMGIDIRNGVQMECIGCTACIDACDEIMTKISQPRGLIRYDSLKGKMHLFSPRAIVYGVFLLASIGGLAASITNRTGFVVTVLRATDTPYQVLNQNGQSVVLNHFRLHLHNQSRVNQKFDVKLPKSLSEKLKVTLPPEKIEVPALTDRQVHFFVIAPVEILNAQGEFGFSVEISSSESLEPIQKSMTLIGPLNPPLSQDQNL